MQAHKIDMLPYILSKRDLPPKMLQVSPSLGILQDLLYVLNFYMLCYVEGSLNSNTSQIQFKCCVLSSKVKFDKNIYSFMKYHKFSYMTLSLFTLRMPWTS